MISSTAPKPSPYKINDASPKSLRRQLLERAKMEYDASLPPQPVDQLAQELDALTLSFAHEAVPQGITPYDMLKGLWQRAMAQYEKEAQREKATKEKPQKPVAPLAEELRKVALAFKEGQLSAKSAIRAYQELYVRSLEQAEVYDELQDRHSEVVSAHDKLMVELEKQLPADMFGSELKQVKDAYNKARETFDWHEGQQAKETANFRAFDSNADTLAEKLQQVWQVKSPGGLSQKGNSWSVSHAYQNHYRVILKMIRLYQEGKEAQTRVLNAQSAVTAQMENHLKTSNDPAQSADLMLNKIVQLREAYEGQAAAYDSCVQHQMEGMNNTEMAIIASQKRLIDQLNELLTKPDTEKDSETDKPESSKTKPVLDQIV